MSRWEDFATSASVEPSALARTEDQPILTSADDYALFQEMTFMKIADEFLILPSNLRREHFSDVVKHRMKSYDHNTLRTQQLTFAFHGFGGRVRYGKCVVSETKYPRGYRITRLWMGEKGNRRNKWISWRDAVTNMYVDDLMWV